VDTTTPIEFDQILAAIKKLPAAKTKKLLLALNDDFIDLKASKELLEFERFLLQGPTMTDEQYENHLADREHFSRWRTM